MTTSRRPAHSNGKQSRSVFLSFEFQKDAGRRGTFMGQAEVDCEFALIDKSLPSAQHDEQWRREAKARIEASAVVIVLLGPDTYNAPGVKDELSLAGGVRCPVVQLMPQNRNYGLVAKNGAICEYKWKTINRMLRDPKAFADAPENKEKRMLCGRTTEPFSKSVGACWTVGSRSRSLHSVISK